MPDLPLGAVLAGGLARRMGGGDKPLRRIGGRTILARVVERLAPQCRGLILSANGDPARFAACGLPVVADTVPDFAGPLAGLLAALDHAAEHHPEVTDVVTVPADTPFLPPDLVARLEAARKRAGTDLACAASAGRLHPVAALWPVRIRDALRQAIGEGERGVGRFAARYGPAVAEWEAEPADPFFNVNTPADLDIAEGLLGSADAPSRSGQTSESPPSSC